MPILTLYRRLVLSVVGTVAVGCGGGDSTGPGLPPLPNEVRLESDPGDYIGGGGSYVYTLANADIQVWTDRGYFNIAIAGDERWSGDFQLPNRLGRIEPGTYDGVARYPFHDPSVGGMSWRGEGRGCNSLSARIAIDSVRYAGEELASVALRFEQRCEGASSALRGTIRWRSDDETRPAGPLHPVPGTLWKPAVVVPSGTFVHLSSQAGDYIGAGTMYTYTPADAEIIATEDQGLLRVTVDAEEWWAGEFQAMHSLDRIEPGYYGDLRRYPFNNPTKGGLSWTGNGRGCNELVGWFAVDDVTYGDGALANISIRFEQICDGGPGALRGAVRWQRPEQTTAP